MRATRLGHAFHSLRGTLPFDMLALHKRYGDVVRIAPNQLAFSHATSWQEIQGHRSKGQAEFRKSDDFYRVIKERPIDIINAGREEHGMLRRTLANGFSDKGLREQQPLITKYIDLLIKRLHENCQDGEVLLDISKWYNWTTFDVIGDLAFGEPFGCLESSTDHPWVELFFKMARAGTALQALSMFPRVRELLLKLVPGSVRAEATKHEVLSHAKLQRRMEGGKERPDLINGLIARKEEWVCSQPSEVIFDICGWTLMLTCYQNITDEQIAANAGILVIAGSETTATLLAGVTYYLMKNPDVLKKVNDEVRSTFKSEDEITFTSINELPYMIACLTEGLRIYPPVAAGLPRVVPEGGATIGDTFVPEEVCSDSISSLAMNS